MKKLLLTAMLATTVLGLSAQNLDKIKNNVKAKNILRQRIRLRLSWLMKKMPRTWKPGIPKLKFIPRFHRIPHWQQAFPMPVR